MDNENPFWIVQYNYGPTPSFARTHNDDDGDDDDGDDDDDHDHDDDDDHHHHYHSSYCNDEEPSGYPSNPPP